MAKKKRPHDFNIVAHQIVQEATQEKPADESKPVKEKNPAAVALGRLSGLKGGKVRAARLSPKTTKEIAQKAAAQRWKDKKIPD